jgi:hypothetical protein
MHVTNATMIGALCLAIGAGACNRQPDSAAEVRDEVAERAAEAADRAAEVEKQRNDAVSELNERVARIEREYAEKSAEVATGAKTATAALQEEVKEDVAAVKTAVADLGTTTADNWWTRHEEAMMRTASDVEADVKRLAGNVATAAPLAAGPIDAPFTSRRDAFVVYMKGRVDAFKAALDRVKASGPRETELDDTRARVTKLGEDLDRLATADPDDWWDVTEARVKEYVDRVEASVKRLDDNRRRS